MFSAACLVLDQLIPYHTMGEYRVVDALYYFKRSLQLLPCALLGSAGGLLDPEPPLSLLRNVGFAMPWWRRGERRYCSRCGREIVFDDVPHGGEPPAAGR